MKIKHNFSLKGLLDGKKSADNQVINDLPSQSTFIEQKLIEPVTPKSTFGLLGFEGDMGSLTDRILKSQEVGEDEIIKKVLDDERGNVQIQTKTDGGVQTRMIEVGHEFANTVNQDELSKMSAEEQAEIERILQRVGSPNQLLPVHQLTDDNVKDPQGKKNAKQIVQGATGIRAFVDNINIKVGSMLSGIGKSGVALNKKKATSNIKNMIPTGSKSIEVPESAKNIASSVDLDNPFASGIGQFA